MRAEMLEITVHFLQWLKQLWEDKISHLTERDSVHISCPIEFILQDGGYKHILYDLSTGFPLWASGFLWSSRWFWNVPYIHISAFFSHAVPSAWNDLPSWTSWDFSLFIWDNSLSFLFPLGRGLWPPQALLSFSPPRASPLTVLHMPIW